MARMTIDSGGSKSAPSSSTKGAKATTGPAKSKGGGRDNAALIKVVVSVVVILGAGVWLLYNQGLIGTAPKAPIHAEAEPTAEQVQEVKEKVNREAQEQNTPGAPAAMPKASS